MLCRMCRDGKVWLYDVNGFLSRIDDCVYCAGTGYFQDMTSTTDVEITLESFELSYRWDDPPAMWRRFI